MSKIDKHELCFKSIISALSQLDKLNLGSYEQRTEVITALLNKFEIINTDKLQHQLEIQTKRVENLKKSNEFYADEENWTIDGHTHEEETYYVREHGEFGVTVRGDVDSSYRYGGKLARSCQKIDQELEKELENLK